jgi:hypothetical protein
MLFLFSDVPLVRIDDANILHLDKGEEELQSVLLQLAGKVNAYLDKEDTVGSK